MQTTFYTRKGSEQVIAVVVYGPFVGRFMGFFLKVVNRLVLNLTVENCITLPYRNAYSSFSGRNT